MYTTKDAGFSYGYFYTLSLIIDTYGKFLGAEVLKPYYDVYNFLTDKDFCDKYLIKQFPDEVFIDSFSNCLKKEDVVELEELNSYVMNKMGGFNIDGWILKMKL